MGKSNMCDAPDRDEPRLRCGYPLPCPWHAPLSAENIGDRIADAAMRGPDPWDKACHQCGQVRCACPPKPPPPSRRTAAHVDPKCHCCNTGLIGEWWKFCPGCGAEIRPETRAAMAKRDGLPNPLNPRSYATPAGGRRAGVPRRKRATRRR